MTTIQLILAIIVASSYAFFINALLWKIVVRPFALHLATAYAHDLRIAGMIDENLDYIQQAKTFAIRQFSESGSPASQLAEMVETNQQLQEDGLSGQELVVRDCIGMAIAQRNFLRDSGHSRYFRMTFPGRYWFVIGLNVTYWLSLLALLVLVVLLLF